MSSVAKIHQEAFVCKEAILSGHVTIGKGTVVHPKCVIEAVEGSIVIGEVRE